MDKLFLNGIMGLVTGDALGAPVEFGERWMRDLDPVKEMRSGGLFEVPVGGWTDDTSMVLATLESLITGFNPENMMHQFIAWLRQGKYSLFDYPIGIGKQILAAIEHYEKNGDINTCGGSKESDNGNGSLMRILPICLYGYKQIKEGDMTLNELISMIHQASGLTHNHARSKIACGLYYFIAESILEEKNALDENGVSSDKSALIHCIQSGIDKGFEFYQGNSGKNFFSEHENVMEELEYYTRLRDLKIFKCTEREEINSTGYVVDTLEAAVWSLITENCLEKSLLKAVNLGLDTDTIAAAAGGLAGLYYGYSGIPQKWLEQIQKRQEIEGVCAWFDGYLGII